MITPQIGESVAIMVSTALGVAGWLYRVLIKPTREALHRANVKLDEMDKLQVKERFDEHEGRIDELETNRQKDLETINGGVRQGLETLRREEVAGRRTIHERLSPMERELSALNEQSRSNGEHVKDLDRKLDDKFDKLMERLAEVGKDAAFVAGKQQGRH